ncbi:MAG: type II toxin-antitoxin system RelE/ParE family toxin [ANME-2 cluster archaeon]|nr:type II toxin-antitoxin system RelE/ParE family toxin [ANME-2 cluster archaeon]MBC2707884.1 type II toxin-antitoxin system RelE/ParE family toxin [ANME-2 cluster archaeon]MBC2748589.1 type II toxin-antitoxin system RelE/ParE family toxin [ANME-2 cluster archaeon]
MTYKIIAHPRVQKELQKLFKRDKVRYSHVKKRLEILSDNPEIGKPLRNILKGKRRIHIGSFVIIYEFNKENNNIILLDFEHHDNAYR